MKGPNPLPIKFLWIASRSSCCSRWLNHSIGQCRFDHLYLIKKWLWWLRCRIATVQTHKRFGLRSIKVRRRYQHRLPSQRNWIGSVRWLGQWALPRPNPSHRQYSMRPRRKESPTLRRSNMPCSSTRRNKSDRRRRFIWLLLLHIP